MKKIISVLSILCILLAFCSCGSKSDGSSDTEFPDAPLSYKNGVYKEDFKDDSGNVIASLDFNYPEFSSDEIPDVADTINSSIAEIIDKAADDIRINLDNTADYKERFNITDPTVTAVTFKIVDNEDYFVSFWLNTKTGTDTSDDDGLTTGYTFSTLDGSRLSIPTLLQKGIEYNADHVKALIILEANRTYANGASLEDDKQEIMNSYYDPAGFCWDTDGITFYYSYSALSGGSVKGIYECHLLYDDLAKMIMTPEDFYNEYYDVYYES